MHPESVIISMCDGSSKVLNNDIDPEVWRAMGTARGEEVVALP
jgi:hypothetical protein